LIIGSLGQDYDAPLFCRTCGATLGRIDIVRARVVAWDDAELGGEATLRPAIGAVVTLEPGFVNAKGPHRSGARWFVRGNRRSPVPRVRLPAVITCHCGEETELRLADDVHGFASGSADFRAASAAQRLEDEGLDPALQAELDRRRGLE
jgi:hypothetical protein